MKLLSKTLMRLNKKLKSKDLSRLPQISLPARPQLALRVSWHSLSLRRRIQIATIRIYLQTKKIKMRVPSNSNQLSFKMERLRITRERLRKILKFNSNKSCKMISQIRAAKFLRSVKEASKYRKNLKLRLKLTKVQRKRTRKA
jgi:hypothetical protein